MRGPRSPRGKTPLIRRGALLGKRNRSTRLTSSKHRYPDVRATVGRGTLVQKGLLLLLSVLVVLLTLVLTWGIHPGSVTPIP